MTAPSRSARQAMTLVELLVVLAILGLVGVAVSPLIQSRDDKQTFRNAAEALSLHFADAASRSIGETTESGVWLETVANSTAVLELAFARTPTIITGSTTVTDVNPSIAPPTAVVSLPTSPSPLTGSRIRFLGNSSQFEVKSATQIAMMPNHNLSNDSFPAAGSSIFHSYQIYEPPKKKLSFRTKKLPGNACIDLQYSSLGIAQPGQASLSLSRSFANCLAVAVIVDSSGRPAAVCLRRLRLGLTRQIPGGGSSPSFADWDRIAITSSDAVVFLIGAYSQVGNQTVPSPTDENPGANIQNPHAAWLVLDPTTGATTLVENNAADNVFDAQKFVRQKLGIE